MTSNSEKNKQNEMELIQRIISRDVSAFDILYKKHINQALSLGFHFLGSKSDAEDILHDVFIDVWYKIDAYDSNRGSVLAWILLKVRSRCLDRLRKINTAKKHESSMLNLEKSNPQILNIEENNFDNIQLHKSLNFLTDKQRNVIELSYFKGLTCVEISKYYDIPLGTVKTRLLSAVTKLRTRLDKKEVLLK